MQRKCQIEISSGKKERKGEMEYEETKKGIDRSEARKMEWKRYCRTDVAAVSLVCVYV
jgi:hypothetical protein